MKKRNQRSTGDALPEARPKVEELHIRRLKVKTLKKLKGTGGHTDPSYAESPDVASCTCSCT